MGLLAEVFDELLGTVYNARGSTASRYDPDCSTDGSNLA